MRFRLLAIALFMVLGACNADTDPDKDMAAKLVERGKRELGQSQFQTAEHTFARALEFHPGNDEAHFGHALSLVLTFYEQMSLIVRAAGFGDLVPAATRQPKDEAEMYNRIILEILLPLRDELATAARELDGVQDEDFAFEVDALPLKWNTDTILNLRGTWRIGDVRLAGGLAHGLAGGLDFLFAHELEFDLFDLLDYFTAYTGSFESFDFTLPQLVNVAVHAFDHNKTLLALGERDADGDGEIDGKALPQRAKEHLRVMALDLASLRANAEKHPGLLRRGRDASGTLAVLEVNKALVIKNTDGVLTYGKITIPITQGYEDGLGALADNLAGGGKPVEWKAHVLPVLGVVAVSAAVIVSQLDLDLSDTVEDVLALITSPSTVESLALDIVPDVVAFDPGAYFKSPVGLRSFLPRWRTDAATPENERSFLFEWECAQFAKSQSFAMPGTTGSFLWYADGDEEADYHFTCPSETSTDAPHFPTAATAPGASIYAELGIGAIAADGVKSRLPAMVFGDPGFAGFLLLQADPKAAPGQYPVGHGKLGLPDQRSLNAFIGQVYENIGL